MKYNKYLKWFAVASTIGMLLILLGGALVTKTDSGMGCGRHWPGCNGQLIPDEITAEVLIEFSHRIVTGSVGILNCNISNLVMEINRTYSGNEVSVNHGSVLPYSYKRSLVPPKYYGDKAISYLRYTLVFHFYLSHPFYFLHFSYLR